MPIRDLASLDAETTDSPYRRPHSPRYAAVRAENDASRPARPSTAPVSFAQRRPGTSDDLNESPKQRLYAVYDTPVDILNTKRRLTEFNDRGERVNGSGLSSTAKGNPPEPPILSIGFHR